jgi:hypothetical protein
MSSCQQVNKQINHLALHDENSVSCSLSLSILVLEYRLEKHCSEYSSTLTQEYQYIIQYTMGTLRSSWILVLFCCVHDHGTCAWMHHSPKPHGVISSLQTRHNHRFILHAEKSPNTPGKSASDFENDTQEEGSSNTPPPPPPLTVQEELDQWMASQDPNKSILGFTPSNFDESKLPIPAFTAIFVLVASLYLIGYGFYVGLVGFPEGDFPRPL